MNLEILKKTLEENYYNNLLEYHKKTNTNEDLIVDGKNLCKIEESLSDTDNNIITKTNSSETPQNTDVSYSDDYLYKKPWAKLSNIHKIIKLKEFISKLLINDKDEMEILKNKITKLVQDKTLTKKDKVKYDDIKGRVIAIPILTFKNGKYQINQKI